MKTNNAHRRSRAPRALAAALATFSLFALLGACEDPLTAVAQESVRLASLPEHTLTMLAPSDGSASPAAGTYKIKDGEPMAISATANGGYTFMGWDQIGGTGTATFADELAASTTVSVTGGDATIQAIIDDLDYTITVTAGTGGTVSQSSLAVTQGNPSGTVTATPGSEYTFAGWTVTAGIASGITFNPNASAQSVTVTATKGDATIQANFALRTYTLTMTNGSYGYTSPYTSATVTSGVKQRIIAYPYGTYAFDGWTKVSGGTVTFDDASARDTYVTITGGAATIKANYRKAAVSLTQVGSLAFQSSTTYPDSGQSMYRYGNDVYVFGKYGTSSSVIRQVSISSLAAPTSSSYRYITGTPAGLVGDGTYLVAGSSSNMYRMAISGFGYASTLTSPTTALPVRDLSLNYEDPEYIWASLTDDRITPIVIGSMGYGYNILSDVNYTYSYIQATNGGLLAIGEMDDSNYLLTYDVDAVSSASYITSYDDYDRLNTGGDMNPGEAGKPILDVDNEYAIVPFMDPSQDDNYFLSFFEVTDYSSASYEGSVTIPGSIRHIATDDYYVYVAADVGGAATIFVVDMFNRSAPSVTQTLTVTGFEKVDLVGTLWKDGYTYVYCLVDTAAGKPVFRVYRLDLS